LGPYNTPIDVGLRVMYKAYIAKGEVKHGVVWFYTDSKELGRELSRAGPLRMLCEDTAKLRGLSPKIYKFFLLDRCPKYVSIEREELSTEEEIVTL
jgi:hypothetical protein